MATADWSFNVGSLDTGSVARAITGGTSPPTGGGTFVRGYRSYQTVQGVLCEYCVIASFNPLAKGGVITGAIQKATATDLSVWLYLAARGNNVSDAAYMLGLSRANPAHLILRKGPLAEGLPDDPPGSSGVLARSTDTFAVDEWVHLKLEHVVNTSGDVVLNVYRDTSTDVSSPTWAKVAGMSDYPNGVEYTAFIDDAIGANSGSLPYPDGRAGKGARFDDTGRVAYIDHITLARQT